MHAEELRKIKNATDGWFKGKARKRIRESLQEAFVEINASKKMEPGEQREELVRIVNKWTGRRQSALAMGASGYSDPEWAAAAACESWALSIMGYEGADLIEVEELIRELLARE